MNLSKKKTSLYFISTLTFIFITPIFLPWMKIAFFIPFLVILIYKNSLTSCLWGSLGCGIILDLLSPHSRLGVDAVSFALTTTILYEQRRIFFADSISTLPIMTFFYSALSTLIRLILLNIFDKSIFISSVFMIKALVFMPLADAFFAFLVYVLPFILFGKPIRKGKDYFSAE